MQKVTPIMRPRSGVHHPRSINAMPTDTARRDLFAPSPADPGSTAEQRATAEAETAAGVNAARKKKVPSLRQGGVTYGAPSAILIGEAGANLVLSKLQGWGIPTQVAMPGIAYDLIADVARLDLLRIQVKTRSEPKGQSCSFAMSRGFYYSRAGVFDYARDDFDIAAFVCLSIGAVFFCASPVRSISVRRAWMQSPTIARDSFDLALQAIQRRRHIDRLSWLASMNEGAPAPNLAPDFAPQPVSCSRPHPVPCSAQSPEQSSRHRPARRLTLLPALKPRPAPMSGSGSGPMPIPAPARVSVPSKAARREPSSILPALDALDAVDWDEALATFSDDGMDAIIPI